MDFWRICSGWNTAFNLANLSYCLSRVHRTLIGVLPGSVPRSVALLLPLSFAESHLGDHPAGRDLLRVAIWRLNTSILVNIPENPLPWLPPGWIPDGTARPSGPALGSPPSDHSSRYVGNDPAHVPGGALSNLAFEFGPPNMPP